MAMMWFQKLFQSPKGVALPIARYWTDAGTFELTRCNLDGTEVEVIQNKSASPSVRICPAGEGGSSHGDCFGNCGWVKQPMIFHDSHIVHMYLDIFGCCWPDGHTHTQAIVLTQRHFACLWKLDLVWNCPCEATRKLWTSLPKKGDALLHSDIPRLKGTCCWCGFVWKLAIRLISFIATLIGKIMMIQWFQGHPMVTKPCWFWMVMGVLWSLGVTAGERGHITGLLDPHGILLDHRGWAWPIQWMSYLSSGFVGLCFLFLVAM